MQDGKYNLFLTNRRLGMGKQIEFFMANTDEIELLHKVSEQKDLILNDKALPMTLEEAANSSSLSLFIVSGEAMVYKSNSGFLDAIVSEAIQFSRGMRRDSNVIRTSRLWAESMYYDSNHKLTKKSKYFNDMFSFYVNWIKRNFKPSKCKNYFIGNEAYRLYKEEGYIMLAGPKHIVEFD